MEPTNFCRQLQKHILAGRGIVTDKEYKNITREDLLAKLQEYTKFILPNGGITIEDNFLKGIDDKLELQIPYNNIILEYRINDNYGNLFSKTIVILETITKGIKITRCEKYTNNEWTYEEMCILPKTNYITRNKVGKTKLNYIVKSVPCEEDIYLSNTRIIASVVFSFLNALACSNVKTQKLYAKQPRKQKKNSLPFDDYHILMLTNKISNGTHGNHSEHRSPREHLRRGHIRRCHSGLTIWINSMVVNAGTKGKITKDYKI